MCTLCHSQFTEFPSAYKICPVIRLVCSTCEFFSQIDQKKLKHRYNKNQQWITTGPHGDFLLDHGSE